MSQLHFSQSKILNILTNIYYWNKALPWPSLCSAGCAPEHRPLPLCSWRSAVAPEPHTAFCSCWWHTLRTLYTAPLAGCSWSESVTWAAGRRWWFCPLPHRHPWPGCWAEWRGTIAPQTDDQWCWKWGCWPSPGMCSFPVMMKEMDKKLW